VDKVIPALIVGLGGLLGGFAGWFLAWLLLPSGDLAVIVLPFVSGLVGMTVGAFVGLSAAQAWLLLLLKSRRAWGAAAVGSLVLFFCLRPPNRVSVTVGGIGSSTQLLCLIAETSSGPVPLRWGGDPFFEFPPLPKGRTTGRMRLGAGVSWRDGKRYGVLIRDRDDRWLVFWLRPEEVRLRGRYPLIGGGEADIDLPPKDRGEPASEELLDAVGFGSETPRSGRESG
jgi:hypothetical protein